MFAPRLKALGHDITISAFYGLQGAPLNWGDIKVLPGGKNAYGNDTLLADATHTKADAVITLMDVWVLEPEITGRVPWYPWLPVDHDPAPPAVVASLKTARRPIAFSRFGERMLRDADCDPLYVPHGVDTSEFKPLDRAACRKELGFESDEFIVGMNMANKGAPSRKAFDQQIRAFAAFRKRHNDARLYLHTDMIGTQGENLRRIIELADIPPGTVIEVPTYRYARGFIGWDWLAKAYNACDVMLNATRGEGFGIPIVEAQACGTPVIVTDFSSMSELVDPALGWRVGYNDKVFYQDAYQVVPDVAQITDALEAAYQKRNDADHRAAVCAWAQQWDADVVTERYWKPALEMIARAGQEQDQALSDSRRRRRAKRQALREKAKVTV